MHRLLIFALLVLPHWDDTNPNVQTYGTDSSRPCGYAIHHIEATDYWYAVYGSHAQYQKRVASLSEAKRIVEEHCNTSK